MGLRGAPLAAVGVDMVAITLFHCSRPWASLTRCRRPAFANRRVSATCPLHQEQTLGYKAQRSIDHWMFASLLLQIFVCVISAMESSLYQEQAAWIGDSHYPSAITCDLSMLPALFSALNSRSHRSSTPRTTEDPSYVLWQSRRTTYSADFVKS